MSVIDWLLDSDPAIRWQVPHDLTGASPAEVTAGRARVAPEGRGEDGVGQPSRWNTLRALYLLDRWDRAPRAEGVRLCG